MEAENAAPVVTVPVKVPEPEEHAPPTLAEPASGPAAEMSGALHAEKDDEGAIAAPSSAVATDTSVPTESTSTNPVATADDTSVTHTADDKPALAHNTEDTENAAAADTTEIDQELETNAPDNKRERSSNGKRKSTGGVPEHKSKKLNKKKSAAKITHLDAKPGDFYFARLKSYPPWPSVICDEEMLPLTLLNTRPVTTKKKDGTYNEPYADGGKKVSERTYPIMFLYTNEFAWIPNTDLSLLEPDACKDVSEKSKTKSLIAAYQVAAENHDLQFFKKMLYEHTKAVEEDERIREEKEAEKAAKADKKKRKSDVKAATEDEDVVMEDAEEGAEPKKSSKKRKKEAEEGDEESEKPAKTPKTTKLKLTTNKTPATSEKKAKEPKAAKPKSDRRKSKPAADDDEEMVDAEPKEEEKPLDPAEERKAREKEVLFLRHKLQKGFLSRDQAPQEDEMPAMSNFIKKLENYKDLEVSIIRTTKINKVLKALIKLNTIPKDEEYNFRKRSLELLGKWNKILGAEPADGELGGAEKEPTTNGVHEDKAEEKSEEVPEPTERQLEPAEAMEKVAAEVDANAEAKAEVIEALDKDLPEEERKTDVNSTKPEPTTIEKAPESTEGAAVAHEVVASAE